MRQPLQRIRRDFGARRNIDAYIIASAAVVFGVMSVIGDFVPDRLRWGVLLGGVGVLVYRMTIPDRNPGSIDAYLADRSSFARKPLRERLRNCQQLWLFSPSGVNFLSQENCDVIRTAVLSRPDGVVRVVILDPDATAAVNVAAHQLDDSLLYPIQRLRPSLEAVMRQLRMMALWPVAGSFGYRLMDFNPGFSLVIVDPGSNEGTVIVEFHGYHNESVNSRMHMEITRRDSARWYAYWTAQFEHLWEAARQPSA